MIKKRPSHGKIVILTEVYFSANHEQHLLTFFGLQNGVRPTERAPLTFTQPWQNLIYYKVNKLLCTEMRVHGNEARVICCLKVSNFSQEVKPSQSSVLAKNIDRKLKFSASL